MPVTKNPGNFSEFNPEIPGSDLSSVPDQTPRDSAGGKCTALSEGVRHAAVFALRFISDQTMAFSMQGLEA